MAPLLSGSMTSGLVGEMQHQVLPPVAPWVTMVITLAAMVVSFITHSVYACLCFAPHLHFQN